jgi:hypothetical protein
MRFTSSWDDGHPLDLRLAERLARHGIEATFYCPLRNAEGRPVMDPAALRELDAAFEIGGHTQDHAYASHMPSHEWAAQVRTGKAALEDILGHEVAGFCYPGGKVEASSRSAVVQAGFRYARTTENLRLCIGSDAFLLPTTLQLYEHGRLTLLGNLLTKGNWSHRRRSAAIMISTGSVLERFAALLDEAQRVDGVLHLWGHSWELEDCGLWALADDLFRMVAERVPPQQRVRNAALPELLARP